jgi:hypothetical protein
LSGEAVDEKTRGKIARGEGRKGDGAKKRKEIVCIFVIFDLKPDASTALSIIKPVTLSEVEVLKQATLKL